MSLPKVTVIMNTLNEDKKFLVKAIESYYHQKGVELEFILSTVEGDHSIEIAKLYPNIKVVTLSKEEHSPNGERSPSGAYKQLNNALTHITGEYFCYASSNDTAEPYKLYNEVRCLKLSKKLVCYSDFYTMNENDRKINVRRFPDYIYKRHLENNFVNDCSMVDSSIVKLFLPFDLSLKNLGHWDLWLRVYEELGDVFYHNPNPTWNYRLHSTSMREIRQKDDKKKRQEREDRKNMLKRHGVN